MIFFHLYVDKPFNCSAVEEMLRKDLVALCNLNYNNMAIALQANGVITRQEKEEIDKMAVNADKMAKIIDIVQASLLGNKTKKYKGLLKAMEQSQDTDLQDKAKELGE